MSKFTATAATESREPATVAIAKAANVFWSEERTEKANAFSDENAKLGVESVARFYCVIVWLLSSLFGAWPIVWPCSWHRSPSTFSFCSVDLIGYSLLCFVVGLGRP